jgi:TolB-like protein/DNA-binding winged helix-turn-helix (wHTH) protein
MARKEEARMDEPFQQSFGRIVVEPARRRLVIDGEPAKMGARAFDLLMALIDRRDRVVSKDELLDIVWPNVTVEEGNLQVQIATLRKLLGAEAIATVPGQGYRFVAPNGVRQTFDERPAPAPEPPHAEGGRILAPRWRGWLSGDRRLLAFGTAALIVLAVAGAWAWGLRAPTAPASSKPSLAIIPFVNVSGDELSGQLAKGVTTDIATDFSRYRDVDAIGDSVTASMSRPDLDARKVAKDLKVQYVLTGAVQREGDLIQVSAQVTDGETGASVWSNRWQSKAAGDLLALQADVADGVASTLGSRNFFAMKAIGAARAKVPEARTAYDLFALGYAAYLKGTADGFAESKRYFDAAIAKDPRLTLAYVQRGWATWLYADVARADEGAALAETERYVRKAIEIDPLDAEAHVELAAKLALFGDFALSEAEVERGLRLNPSSADVMMKAALSMPWLGRPERGAELCDRAFRLNAMPVVWYAIHCVESYYFMGRYREAIDMVQRTQAWIPPSPWSTGYQLASAAELGDGSASATLAEFKRRFPGVTVESLGYGAVYRRAHERDQLVASMIKAGAPLCVPPDKADALPKLMHLAVCDAERAKEAAR